WWPVVGGGKSGPRGNLPVPPACRRPPSRLNRRSQRNKSLFLRKIVFLRLTIEYVAGMKQFTAIIHRGEPDEGGFWATCLEVPGANGQGETKEDCLQNLREAIQLILENEREEAFRLDPQAETAELLLA